MKRFTLGFSPCPNDTFIFDALVNKKIDTKDFSFDVLLEDVQTLNKMAQEEALDLVKISYGNLPLIIGNYKILESGGALGKGVGPLLIAKNKIEQEQVNKYKIAIPGENTTAHLLFSLAFPAAKNKIFLKFDEIENEVVIHDDTLGVIIHENRFTYMHRGLQRIMDLGEFWEKQTGLPIPLGGIAVNRRIDHKDMEAINLLIQQSVNYAFHHYPALPEYVKQHSQEMEETVMRKHIDLYVNNYSVRLGDDGKNAVRMFLDIYKNNNSSNSFEKKFEDDLFV